MNLPGVPLLDALSQRMRWLDARQSVLSQNVANADSPGYMAQDLKAPDFAAMLSGGSGNTGVSLRVTDPRHIGGASSNGLDLSKLQETAPDTQANPTGNTVSIDDEMIKVADTQAQYQAASSLYTKAIGMMRRAIGNG